MIIRFIDYVERLKIPEPKNDSPQEVMPTLVKALVIASVKAVILTNADVMLPHRGSKLHSKVFVPMTFIVTIALLLGNSFLRTL